MIINVHYDEFDNLNEINSQKSNKIIVDINFSFTPETAYAINKIIEEFEKRSQNVWFHSILQII